MPAEPELEFERVVAPPPPLGREPLLTGTSATVRLSSLPDTVIVCVT